MQIKKPNSSNIQTDSATGQKDAGNTRGVFKRITQIIVEMGRSIKRFVFHLFGRTPEAHNTKANMSDTQVFDNLAETPVVRSRHSSHSDRTVSQKYRAVPHISKEHLSGEGKEHINMFQTRRHQPGVVISVMLTSVRLVLIAMFMVAAAGAGVLVGVSKAYMETTPKLDTGKIEDQSQTSFIYDCNGSLITAYTGTENRDWATIDEIPKQLQDAVIDIEDVRFKYHSGVDIKRLVGAFVNNLMNSNVQGGSTITQQLIKNRLLSTERTYKRKIQEAYLALQLEKEYSKDEILEAYMNTISLGASNYGVKAAAMDYFGKNLDELSLRECAMLAGITRYPYLYNPRRCYYDAQNPKIINDRTDDVLYQMYKAGDIDYDEYQAALDDTVSVLEKSKVNEMYQMPYFVEYAVYDVITHLLKQRNMQDNDQNRAQLETELRTNGYRIYTTVDPEVQKTVEQSLAEWDAYPKLEDESNSVIHYDNDDGTVTDVVQPQAAAVVIDQSTGDLKAVVGGRNTPTARKTLNRAYQTTMPVGSSIKPLSVYGPALDKGNSDGTVVPNLPLPIEGWVDDSGKETYPSGGTSSYGPVTLRTGLVQSLNSATAWTLMNVVGLDDSYNYLLDMGINPAHINKTGAGLALGTSGITPIEMAGAYAAIANSGVYQEPLSFSLVTDRDGNVILDANEIRDSRQVFKPSTAWLLTDMLVDAVSSDSGTGKNARIEGMTVGGKTGTNQNAKGIYFAGFTPYYTMTLWIGHDNYKPLASDVYASSSAAPLWQYIMAQLVNGKTDAPIIDKDPTELGLVKVKICSVSGKLATDACEADSSHPPIEAWYPADEVPTEYCDWHQLYPVCKESGKIATPYCPEEDIEMKSLLFIPEDSIYWQLTAAQRQKYLPGSLHALANGMALEDLDPSMTAYYDYYCDIHTKEWYDGQVALGDAIDAAKNQLDESNAVLTDPKYAMSMNDKQQLINKINELTGLISDSSSTTAAIEQVTEELRQLTVKLVSIYSGIETESP
jgi:penicillin-binding protein 1A